MSTSAPGPLRDVLSATQAGWRLTFIPNLVFRVGSATIGVLVVPFLCALPLTLSVLCPIGLFVGSAAVWRIGLGILALLAIIGVVLGVLSGYLASTEVRWVEFRPGEAPTQVFLARLRRSSAIAVTDLRRVVVVERVKLLERTGIDLVLHTADEKVVCTAQTDTPMGQVSPQALAAWLTELLGPAAVPVECEKVIEKTNMPGPEWMRPEQVAAVWQVPVEQVPELASQWGVRTYVFVPRAAIYRSGTANVRSLEVLVYEPDRVCEVAEQVRRGESE